MPQPCEEPRLPAPRCRVSPTSIFLQHSSLSLNVFILILFCWPPLRHDQAFTFSLKLSRLLLTPERPPNRGRPNTNPMMDAERGRCVPRIRKVGRLGVKFNWAQVVGRFVSVLFELGAVCFIAWLYSYWRTEPTTRVDVLFPSFFPVGWIRCAVIPPEPLTDAIVQLIFGIAADTYEVVSLLFLNRRRAINAVAVCCDVAVIGTGIFCFLLLSVVDRGSGERRAYWVTDMTNAMIFMIVFWFVKSIPRPQASWKLVLTRSDPQHDSCWVHRYGRRRSDTHLLLEQSEARSPVGKKSG